MTILNAPDQLRVGTHLLISILDYSRIDINKIYMFYFRLRKNFNYETVRIQYNKQANKAANINRGTKKTK